MGDAANNNANPNGAINDRAVFCPACGAADIQASSLAGGAASCNVCGWKGCVEDLVVFRFSHDMGTTEEVYRAFFLDVRKLFGQQIATNVGLLLLKWGFLPELTPRNMKEFTKLLTRYVAAAAMAMTQSFFKTRADIEKEHHREQPAG
jgi:hypothetical protein